MSLQSIVILFGIYASITLLAPRALVGPQLLNSKPKFVLTAWMSLLVVAGLSLIAALVGLAGRALQQHVVETDSARIIVPILEYVFGWIAVAALGVLAFRLVASMSELRSARRELMQRWSMIAPIARTETIAGHHVKVFDSPEKVVMAIPAAHAIIVSTAVVSALTPTQLEAALTHEQAHLDGHHGAVREAGILAVAVAPGFSASARMAQATRIATELIADDVAVDKCGRETVAEALIAAFGESALIEERVARLRS